MSDSLSERNRLRVQLQRALIQTRGTDAVELANRLVQLDSTDFEAWNNLAYTHMVHGWQYGRGLPALVVAADRALALDSTNALALYRRAWIAAATDDTADVRRQLARLVAVDTTTDFLRGAALGLRAIVTPDDAAPALLDSISRRPPTEWISALRFLRVSRPDRVMASLGPLRENAAPGLAGQIAMQSDLQMQLGVGRLGPVDAMIRAGAFDALPGVAARLALPIVAASVNGIADPMVADSTLAWLGRYVPIDSAVSWVKGPNLVWHVAWLVGAYHTSFGDTAVARRWRAPLSAIRVPPSVTLREYPTALLTDLDARLAERRGDRAAALMLAGRALTLWDIHTENTFDAHPEPMMRLHLARLLATAGNSDSAARIYASLVPPTTWLGLTTARAWYELAAIAEARQDCATAAPRYTLARRIFELGGPDVTAWRDRARAGEGRCGAR